MASRPSRSELKEYVVLVLGSSTSGKNKAGKFIAGEESFPTRDSMSTMRRQTVQRKVNCNGAVLSMIDTVGLDDTEKSPEKVLQELTTAVLMAADAGGVHAFLLCVNLGTAISDTFVTTLQELEKMKDFWPHSILLFTNVGDPGDTDEERREKFEEILDSPNCPFPEVHRWLLEKVGYPKILLEYVYDDLYLTNEVRKTKVHAILPLIEHIGYKQGVYTNAMIDEAKQYYEEIKLDIVKMKTQAYLGDYSNLALRIVRVIREQKRASIRNLFSQIYYGIQKSRANRQSAPLLPTRSKELPQRHHDRDFHPYQGRDKNK